MRPGKRHKRITISQAAAEAGVARATAAFVISGWSAELRISPQAIERVKAVVDRLGYVPNQLARGMITGRTQVFGVVGERFFKYSSQPYQVFKRTVAERRLQLDSKLHTGAEAGDPEEPDWGLPIARSGNRPDAIVALNDPCGLRMLHSLRRHGLRVPDDIRVAALGDKSETVEATAQLTSIREPIREIGQVAPGQWNRRELARAQGSPAGESAFFGIFASGSDA